MESLVIGILALIQIAFIALALSLFARSIFGLSRKDIQRSCGKAFNIIAIIGMALWLLYYLRFAFLFLAASYW